MIAGIALLGMTAIILSPLRVDGQTNRFWQGASGDPWNVSTNWTLGAPGFPNAPGDGALNIQTVSASTTQATVGGVTVGTIGHDAVNVNTSWTIGTTTPITLNNLGAGAIIRNTNSSTGASNFLSITGTGGLILADNLTISNTGGSTASAGSIRIQTPISGTGNITVSNVSNSVTNGSGAVAFPGAVAFQGANTFVGTTTIAKGETTFNNSKTFSAGQINLGQSGLGDASLVSTANDVNPSNSVVVAAGTGGTSLLGSSGNATYSGLITLNGNVTLTNLNSGGGGTTSYSNTISGNGGVRVMGPGTALLSHANTFVGSTTIDSGTLNAGATSALGGTSSVTVNSTGTLLLSGSFTNRINDAATLTLNGGTFKTGGLSEGSAATGVGGAGGAVGALTLTMNANSVVDFTNGSGSKLVFQNFSLASGTAITIAHWTGTANINGSDQLLFASNPGYTLADLANVQFTTDAGTNFARGAQLINFNGYSELVPVPEPSTWAAGILTVLALGYTQRRRLSRAFTLASRSSRQA
ncbi:MAG: hypothetical protein ACR2HH_05965 [Chthoniobacterales bacterium]